MSISKNQQTHTANEIFADCATETCGEELWEMLLDSSEPESSDEKRRQDGLFVGTFVGCSKNGDAQVRMPELRTDAVTTRSMVEYGNNDIGRKVVVQFEQGDVSKPIIMGFLQSPGEKPATHVEADGDKLEFSAKREIVLRCGESSITLTRAGKILIRGKYLLSRSSGVNRIKGGSVQIN